MLNCTLTWVEPGRVTSETEYLSPIKAQLCLRIRDRWILVELDEQGHLELKQEDAYTGEILKHTVIEIAECRLAGESPRENEAADGSMAECVAEGVSPSVVVGVITSPAEGPGQ